MRILILVLAATLTLAGCDGTGTSSVRVSGNAAVGVSTGDSYYGEGYGGSGPPPGRTAAERQARKDYYRGPRGLEW